MAFSEGSRASHLGEPVPGNEKNISSPKQVSAGKSTRLNTAGGWDRGFHVMNFAGISGIISNSTKPGDDLFQFTTLISLGFFVAFQTVDPTMAFWLNFTSGVAIE